MTENVCRFFLDWIATPGSMWLWFDLWFILIHAFTKWRTSDLSAFCLMNDWECVQVLSWLDCDSGFDVALIWSVIHSDSCFHQMTYEWFECLGFDGWLRMCAEFFLDWIVRSGSMCLWALWFLMTGPSLISYWCCHFCDLLITQAHCLWFECCDLSAFCLIDDWECVQVLSWLDCNWVFDVALIWSVIHSDSSFHQMTYAWFECLCLMDDWEWVQGFFLTGLWPVVRCAFELFDSWWRGRHWSLIDGALCDLLMTNQYQLGSHDWALRANFCLHSSISAMNVC